MVETNLIQRVRRGEEDGRKGAQDHLGPPAAQRGKRPPRLSNGLKVGLRPNDAISHHDGAVLR